ncbi:SigB/SigF/SigG family RNA polymerase sigma factor [Streptomyces sp. NBC_01294]|uniref:SigB/SigF/SigG family RNA polymerase sigma factor n=1 Tax=Streptomyces sp. NBC_01294 TaxID=2903815 RepID=UPI002DD8F80E|nr:SigB/SigF/SigG family RNA polymerase sigma factor [Streptomyces sp. NBC_01294]WRZ58153.1 SigB/SigF/SigG family RNA polymerase sigma factor [Streptomyces sp. NBC_01294]
MHRTDLTDVATHEAKALSVSLFRRLAELEKGSAEYAYVRNTLVELNLSLVKYSARRFRGRSESMEDIVQVGTIGLIKATNRFDPERGVEFASFAMPTITGEIRRFFRDTSWAVKVPRRLQELRIEVAKAHDALEQALGREPTDAELAGHLHVTPEELAEGQKAACAYSARSLDAPAQEEGDREAHDERPTLGEEERAYDRIECLETLKPVLAGLPDRERTLIALRFGQDLTQAEIGDRLGLSQMHVSRLLARTLARMRTCLLTDAAEDPGAADGTADGAADGTADVAGNAAGSRTGDRATPAASTSWTTTLVS